MRIKCNNVSKLLILVPDAEQALVNSVRYNYCLLFHFTQRYQELGLRREMEWLKMTFNPMINLSSFEGS